MPTSRPVGIDARRVGEIDAYVEEHSRRRQGNKVLHGYPPPLLWRQRPVPVSDVMALRQRTAAAVPKRLILYVSTPFCLPTRPDRCGFCLFPSEVFRSRAQLDDLQAIVATGIPHLTHYELNVSGRSAFALDHRDELPSREENLEMYRAAGELLTGAGYRQQTAYDWEKNGGDLPAGYRFEGSWHRPLRSPVAGESSGSKITRHRSTLRARATR